MKDVIICMIIGVLSFVASGVLGDIGFEYSCKALAIIAVIFLGCGIVAYFDKREQQKLGKRLCQSHF